MGAAESASQAGRAPSPGPEVGVPGELQHAHERHLWGQGRPAGAQAAPLCRAPPQLGSRGPSGKWLEGARPPSPDRDTQSAPPGRHVPAHAGAPRPWLSQSRPGLPSALFILRVWLRAHRRGRRGLTGRARGGLDLWE